MDTLTLRSARPDDRDFAYRARRAAFREYGETVRAWDEDEQRQLHEQRFRVQDFRVINLAGTDVGVMALVVTPEWLTVNQLFILPEHQGQGIGSRCMSLIMDEARRLGLPVRLRVLKVNPRALTFYDRLEFVRTGETNAHVLMEKHPS